MGLEGGEKSEKDAETQLKHLRHVGHPVLGERHTEVLPDGADEDLIRAEDGAGVLENGEKQLQREDLGAKLVGPVGGG